MKNSNLLRNVHRMFTIPIYYNKRGKRKIPPHVLAFYSLSYLLLRERPDESPAVPVFCAHNAQAGIEWFVPVGARSARPRFALKGGGEVARASRAGFRRLRAAGRCRCARRTALRLAKSRRKAAVARMHARCGSRRGGLAPSCESPPPGDVHGCPRSQTNLSTCCGKFDLQQRRGGSVLRLTREAGALAMQGLRPMFP